MQRILVLGAGFAGLWAAIGAARARDLAGVHPKQLEILVLDSNLYHSIRVRNYEADLAGTVLPLKAVLDPVGVRHAQGRISTIDVNSKIVEFLSGDERRSVGYDQLICALGSELVRPPIPGLAEHGFDVDTYTGAKELGDHLAALPGQRPSEGQYTVLIVGAGLTGIEVAAEMPARLRAVIETSPFADRKPSAHVILADRTTSIGSAMGGAEPVIFEALQALGVETRTGVSLSSMDINGGTLTTEEYIPAATVVWCAGMKAHPLAAQFCVAQDRLGRLPVDTFLQIKSVSGAFAAGDIAVLDVDMGHESVMSCQHSRPMGRFAGHNAVCALLGQPMLALQIPWYTLSSILVRGVPSILKAGIDTSLRPAWKPNAPRKLSIGNESILPWPAPGRRSLTLLHLLFSHPLAGSINNGQSG